MQRAIHPANKVSTSNPCIHTPYPHTQPQDDVSSPGHAFAAGVTLERVGAHTVDDKGRQTFVTHNPLELLRKVRSSFKLTHQSQFFTNPLDLWYSAAPSSSKVTTRSSCFSTHTLALQYCISS